MKWIKLDNNEQCIASGKKMFVEEKPIPHISEIGLHLLPLS